MLQGIDESFSKNFTKLRDRHNQRENLKRIGICRDLELNETSRNFSSTFNFTLLQSNFSYQMVNDLLYHRLRFGSRDEFEKISNEHSRNEKVFHVNTKVLKALCIKGKTSLNFCQLSLQRCQNVYEKKSLCCF